MILFVSVVKSSKVTTCLELLVEKKIKVDRLLELAISAAALESSEWHLCRLDWNGEPLEILDDVNMTVEGCRLKHGDQLSLEYGCMPPKVARTHYECMNGLCVCSEYNSDIA